MHDVRLPHHDQPDRSDEIDDVRARKDQSSDVTREQELHARHRSREVEIDRSLLLHSRNEMCGGEDRQKRAEEIENGRESRFEAEDEFFDGDLVVGRHGDFLAEQFGARQRAVDDVQIDRRGKNEYENSRQ